ncbi:MAG: hypothetical protein ABGZ23_19905 [Fuerstiella sp.]|nr:hypothetical protein [Fuerstiella sp.]
MSAVVTKASGVFFGFTTKTMDGLLPEKDSRPTGRVHGNVESRSFEKTGTLRWDLIATSLS